MNRLLYPIVASALITIVPFLLTFEKGQDITRGLIGYEYFALLLLFVLVKSKLRACATKQSMLKNLVSVVLLAVVVVALFAVAWLDLQNLLAITCKMS